VVVDIHERGCLAIVCHVIHTT